MSIYTYVLDKFGTDVINGLGFAGNIELIYQVISNNPNSNIHVDWYSKGKCIVYDSEYEEKTKIINPFEYYFNQKYEKSNNVMNFHNLCVKLPYGNCNKLNDDLYKLYKKKFNEQFELKKEILDEINLFYDTYLKDKIILGIQVRLTDMIYYHNVNNIDYYINKTKEILKNKNIDGIFIASDSNVTYDKFKENFPDISIYYQKNIMRSDKEIDIVQPQERININNIIFNNRKYHNYLNGKEALIDILLLAKCDYFLRSHSSISDIAIIMNDNIIELFI